MMNQYYNILLLSMLLLLISITKISLNNAQIAQDLVTPRPLFFSCGDIMAHTNVANTAPGSILENYQFDSFYPNGVYQIIMPTCQLDTGCSLDPQAPDFTDVSADPGTTTKINRRDQLRNYDIKVNQLATRKEYLRQYGKYVYCRFDWQANKAYTLIENGYSFEHLEKNSELTTNNFVFGTPWVVDGTKDGFNDNGEIHDYHDDHANIFDQDATIDKFRANRILPTFRMKRSDVDHFLDNHPNVFNTVALRTSTVGLISTCNWAHTKEYDYLQITLANSAAMTDSCKTSGVSGRLFGTDFTVGSSNPLKRANILLASDHPSLYRVTAVGADCEDTDSTFWNDIEDETQAGSNYFGKYDSNQEIIKTASCLRDPQATTQWWIEHTVTPIVASSILWVCEERHLLRPEWGGNDIRKHINAQIHVRPNLKHIYPGEEPSFDVLIESRFVIKSLYERYYRDDGQTSLGFTYIIDTNPFITGTRAVSNPNTCENRLAAQYSATPMVGALVKEDKPPGVNDNDWKDLRELWGFGKYRSTGGDTSDLIFDTTNANWNDLTPDTGNWFKLYEDENQGYVNTRINQDVPAPIPFTESTNWKKNDYLTFPITPQWHFGTPAPTPPDPLHISYDYGIDRYGKEVPLGIMADSKYIEPCSPRYRIASRFTISELLDFCKDHNGDHSFKWVVKRTFLKKDAKMEFKNTPRESDVVAPPDIEVSHIQLIGGFYMYGVSPHPSWYHPMHENTFVNTESSNLLVSQLAFYPIEISFKQQMHVMANGTSTNYKLYFWSSMYKYDTRQERNFDVDDGQGIDNPTNKFNDFSNQHDSFQTEKEQPFPTVAVTYEVIWFTSVPAYIYIENPEFTFDGFNHGLVKHLQSINVPNINNFDYTGLGANAIGTNTYNEQDTGSDTWWTSHGLLESTEDDAGIPAYPSGQNCLINSATRCWQRFVTRFYLPRCTLNKDTQDFSGKVGLIADPTLNYDATGNNGYAGPTYTAGQLTDLMTELGAYKADEDDPVGKLVFNTKEITMERECEGLNQTEKVIEFDTEWRMSRFEDFREVDDADEFEPGDKVYVQLYLNTSRYSDYWQKVFKMEIKEIFLCSYNGDPTLNQLNMTINGNRGCIQYDATAYSRAEANKHHIKNPAYPAPAPDPAVDKYISKTIALHKSLIYEADVDTQPNDLNFQRYLVGGTTSVKDAAIDTSQLTPLLKNGWEEIPQAQPLGGSPTDEETRRYNNFHNLFDMFSFDMQPLISNNAFFLQMVIELDLNDDEYLTDENHTPIDLKDGTNTFDGYNDAKFRRRALSSNEYNYDSEYDSNQRKLLSQQQHHMIKQFGKQRKIHIMARGKLNIKSPPPSPKLNNNIANKQNIDESNNNLETNINNKKHDINDYIATIGFPIVLFGFILLLLPKLKKQLSKFNIININIQKNKNNKHKDYNNVAINNNDDSDESESESNDIINNNKFSIKNVNQKEEEEEESEQDSEVNGLMKIKS